MYKVSGFCPLDLGSFLKLFSQYCDLPSIKKLSKLRNFLKIRSAIWSDTEKSVKAIE